LTLRCVHLPFFIAVFFNVTICNFFFVSYIFIFYTNIRYCLYLLIFYTNLLICLLHILVTFFFQCFCNLVDLLNIQINSVNFHSVQNRYFAHSEMQVLLEFSSIYVRFCQEMCTGDWQVVSSHHKLYVQSNHTACIYVLATEYIIVMNYNYEIIGQQTNGNHIWSLDFNSQVIFKETFQNLYLTLLL
jgi:hypothetical protein